MFRDIGVAETEHGRVWRRLRGLTPPRPAGYLPAPNERPNEPVRGTPFACGGAASRATAGPVSRLSLGARMQLKTRKGDTRDGPLHR